MLSAPVGSTADLSSVDRGGNVNSNLASPHGRSVGSPTHDEQTATELMAVYTFTASNAYSSHPPM